MWFNHESKLCVNLNFQGCGLNIKKMGQQVKVSESRFSRFDANMNVSNLMGLA